MAARVALTGHSPAMPLRYDDGAAGLEAVGVGSFSDIRPGHVRKIVLLVVTLAVIAPLVRQTNEERKQSQMKFGLAEFPG
jgi:hypothetical protein